MRSFSYAMKGEIIMASTYEVVMESCRELVEAILRNNF